MGERKEPTPPPADQVKPEPPPAPPVGRLQDMRVVDCRLEGSLILGYQAPGVIQVAHELGRRMMLRNAVALLQRIVDARVLTHAGPDGLELDARRIVRWYADLPPDQRDMTMHVGMDWASEPDRAVAVVPASDTAMTRAELIAALAECYRLTGADPDGNEDWRLAEDAVKEVRRLRHEVERLDAAPYGQAYLVDLKAAVKP